jgi:hypothetical protein
MLARLLWVGFEPEVATRRILLSMSRLLFSSILYHLGFALRITALFLSSIYLGQALRTTGV